MTADDELRERVIDGLNRLSAGYSHKDLEEIVAIVDPHITGFGTGADERVSGAEGLRKQLERDLSQCDEMNLYFSDVEVGGGGSVAWVSCECRAVVVIGGLTQEIASRFTSVLRLEKDTVRFVQVHFSLPAAGQAEGESFPSADSSKPRPAISVRPDIPSDRFTRGP